MINPMLLMPGIVKETVSIGRRKFVALKPAREHFPEHYVGLPEQFSGRTGVLFRGVITRQIPNDHALAVFGLDRLKLDYVESANRIYVLKNIEIISDKSNWEGETGHFRRDFMPEIHLEGTNVLMAATVKAAAAREILPIFPEQIKGETGWSSRIPEPDKEEVIARFQKTLVEKLGKAIDLIAGIQARIINNQPV